MSRAGGEAGRERRRLERLYKQDLEWMARIEALAALSAVLAACEGCGLVQVSTGEANPYGASHGLVQACPVCGCETGSFVDYLPGHATCHDHGHG